MHVTISFTTAFCTKPLFPWYHQSCMSAYFVSKWCELKLSLLIAILFYATLIYKYFSIMNSCLMFLLGFCQSPLFLWTTNLIYTNFPCVFLYIVQYFQDYQYSNPTGVPENIYQEYFSTQQLKYHVLHCAIWCGKYICFTTCYFLAYCIFLTNTW